MRFWGNTNLGTASDTGYSGPMIGGFEDILWFRMLTVASPAIWRNRLEDLSVCRLPELNPGLVVQFL